jgi:putative membrane protein
LKLGAYLGGLLGIALLTALVVHSDVSGMLQTALRGGWQLLWLIPYRTVYFLLYAAGWRILLRPYDPDRRAGMGYLLWVTTVREAIDRLLPVASVGGAVAGVRLLGWREIPTPAAAATVIMEILLTMIASWLFAVVGVVLLMNLDAAAADYTRVILALLLCVPIPLVLARMLGTGSLFGRLQSLIVRFAGVQIPPAGAQALDSAVHASLRRLNSLVAAGALQFAALVSGSVEIWFALRLFGQPVGVAEALILESMVQAFRHVAFVVPASLGVQETVLVVFGHTLGVGAETAIAVSLVKRLREVVYGVASLVSWQWMEGRRLRAPVEHQS